MDHLLLHPHPSIATAARHFVSDWSRQRDLPQDSIEALELLVSEVVANAVVHGRGQVLISIVDGADPADHPIRHAERHPAESYDAGSHNAESHNAGGGSTQWRSGERVVVSVSDAGPGHPCAKALSPDGMGGRGLALVNLLADAWGVTAPTTVGTCHPPPPLADAGVGGLTGGKTTWFTLTTPTR